MNPSQVELYRRVQAFHFDPDDATYTFAMRLAKENGWTPAFTQRVIEEYRRFAFLAAAAGHPVSPSDAVDQAWHLHLVYTRSYWDEFCGKVLRTPLHHDPSSGGRAERAKFDDWYARTLRSYRFSRSATRSSPEASRQPKRPPRMSDWQRARTRSPSSRSPASRMSGASIPISIRLETWACANARSSRRRGSGRAKVSPRGRRSCERS